MHKEPSAKSLPPGKPHTGSVPFGSLLDLFFSIFSAAGTWSARDVARWFRDAGLEAKVNRSPGMMPDLRLYIGRKHGRDDINSPGVRRKDYFARQFHVRPAVVGGQGQRLVEFPGVRLDRDGGPDLQLARARQHGSTKREPWIEMARHGSTPAFLGADADPVLDGWEIHKQVFAALEPVRVQAS
jgi:hypothetical protein